MFERFTQDARQIVITAQAEATELRQPHVGTEHLLLAMLADPGTAGTVLREAGVEADNVRADLVRRVSPTPPLLTEEDVEALRSVGVDADAVLARIEASFGPDALLPPISEKRGWLGRRQECTRFSPRSKKVLELSLREAIRAHDGEIRSGHLLLGLLREGAGLGCQILAGSGVDLADLRQQTERRLRPAA
jgi:ATP-dependent Clp protease ATP-binding subunit ClpA